MSRRRVLFWSALAGSIAAAVGFAVDPDGLGGLLWMLLAAALIIPTTIMPLARGARPLRVWIFQAAATTCLLLSLLSELVTFTVGPLRYSDITYFSAYLCTVVWLLLLHREVGRRRDRMTVLDAGAGLVGVTLALWASVLAPLVDDARLPPALVWAVYPAMDAVLVALCLHMCVLRGFDSIVLRWLLGGSVLLFCLDVLNSLTGILMPPGELPVVMGLYMFYFLALVMAATHPEIVHLARPARTPVAPVGRRAALVTLTIAPALLAVGLPHHGIPDKIVRTLLAALLLGLLFVRLSRTMRAVSDAESVSRHRATHDQLTGLLNRAAMLEMLHETRQVDDERTTAVLFLDCDNFKYVNDTWGHGAGDALLRDIATRLPQCLGPEDVLARHGGDEFIVVSSVRQAQDATRLAERVLRFFDEPIEILPGRTHAITPSIGIAIDEPSRRFAGGASADDADEPGRAGPSRRPGDQRASGDHAVVETEDLVGRADTAMYEAKQRGRGQYVLFDEDLAHSSRVRAVVGDRLPEAIRNEEFTLRLQPILHGQNYAAILGWEALARWRHPDLGDVSPGVFVPLAEQLGLIDDLGLLVLRRACEELAQLRQAMPLADVSMFVNVSPTQLLHPQFARRVREARRAAGLPRDCLWLEVTENLLVDTGPQVLANLAELREAGVRICIDDFGTGYASLATLLRLPIDCVKLDMSLVAPLGERPEVTAQLGAVLTLLSSLGIEFIVAEGVERQEQETELIALGCPMVQGWMYGKPVTSESLLIALGRNRHVKPEDAAEAERAGDAMG